MAVGKYMMNKSQETTAFATPWGLFQFHRLPFGLHRATAMFQKKVDQLLARHQAAVIVYVNDVLIFSHTCEEYIGNLCQVLMAVWTPGLHLNPQKCKIIRNRLYN